MTDTAPTPVTISTGAHAAITARVKQWSGWRDATLKFGTPVMSPWADTDFETRTITCNADVLMLNPNRVLRTLTPFRLRQEAIITGSLIHEAGHARFSHWMPRNKEQAENWRHPDGAEITHPEVAFARMVEEARIEGHMTAQARIVQIEGLDWTMRATVAYLLPFTDLSPQADRQLMQLINSWALRAGRAIAVGHWTGRPIPQWANDFTSLVHQRIEKHLLELRGLTEDEALFGGDDKGANADTREVLNLIRSMMVCEDHTGTTMVDLAKRVLDILFPETDPEDMPTPEAGCSGVPEEDGEEATAAPESDEQGDAGEESDSEAGDDAEGDEEGEDGEGNTDPEDEGSGDEPGAGDSGDESDEAGATDSTEAGDGMSDEAANDLADVQAALEDIEEASQREAKAEQAEESAAAPTAQEQTSLGASDGPSESATANGWRQPDKVERETQASAGKMLRDMIEPTESSKVALTETPAANVDGAALAAWRAAGARQDPRFFIRHHRQVQPSPPVQIAVLVDVSASMNVLQKPSALLSWSVAAAALDLRNFAGRGTQVESTLIHWGSTAEVIQPNGTPLPGIRERECRQGTTVMGDALRLVEEQIPGFFDVPATPVNRLLVQFTDWQLAPWCRQEVTPMLRTALMNGVNMLSITPWANDGDLREIVHGLPSEARERSQSIVYNTKRPDIWPEAAKMLAR